MNVQHVSDRLSQGAVPGLPEMTVKATPYAWREPMSLPRRPWIYGQWFLRGTVACLVAPGGVGKSTFVASTALAMVTGKPLLKKEIWDGPKRVWIWNLEDDLDEMSRSIQAVALNYEIAPAEIESSLFVDSAMEGTGLCTAVEENGLFHLLLPVYDALTAELTRRGIDMLVVDPFVSSHEVDENANIKIDKIAKAWGRVAKKANCCILLVHHTSKAGSSDVTAMSSRGAVALINAARSTLVINRMTDQEGEGFGIAAAERRRYIKVADDKHNRAPAQAADWYELVSVNLCNGDDGVIGDSMPVIVPWALPNPFDDITVRDLLAVQQTISEGQWRQDAQSPGWAGHAVAKVLGLSVYDERDKARIKRIIETWVQKGALVVVVAAGPKRQPVKWIEVGQWVEAASPYQGGAGQGEEG